MKGQPEKPRAVLSPRAAHISSAMSMKREREGGFAIVTAISFMVVVGVLVSTALLLGYSNRARSADTVFTTQAQMASEAGIDYTLKKIYSDVLVRKVGGVDKPIVGNERTYIVYKTFLNKKVFSAADGLAPGSETTLLDKELPANVSTKGVTFTNTVGGQTFTTNVIRRDFDDSNPPQILLTVKSSGNVKRPDNSQVARRVLNQNIYITPQTAQYDFALLANNINCTFCHTKIESIKAAYEDNPVGKDRVRVGTLQELELRVAGLANDWDWTDTVIGGTLYTRGRFLNQFRQEITAPNRDFLTYTIDPAPPAADLPAKILNANLNPLVLQNCLVANSCQKLNNFYTNYPAADGVDGVLPGNFPLPVGDSDGDRVIDDSEWTEDIGYDYARAGNTYGSISTLGTGTLQLAPMTWKLKTGADGTSDANQNSDYVAVPVNSTPYSNLNLGTVPVVVGGLLNSGVNGIQGNLIVKGDFRISGIVYVNGDVVISGRVYGRGRIISRGNIYVTGDIEYLCSTSTLCTASDFAKLDAASVKADPNILPTVLGLLSGGNTLIGDYLSRAGSGRTALTNSASRATWTSGMNFTYAEVANFNRGERNNAGAASCSTSGIKPRFYVFDSSDTRVQYTTSDTAENPNNDGETTKMVYNKTDSTLSDPCVAKGVVTSLSPTGNWTTHNVMKQEWINNVETLPTARPMYKLPFEFKNDFPTCSKLKVYECVYKPLRLDVTLYSANATIAMVRGNTNNNADGSGNQQDRNVDKAPGSRSLTDGRMILNGSLVSADMGVFSPGSEGKKELFTSAVTGGKKRAPGIIINYDPRSSQFLNRKGSGVLSTPLRSYFSLDKDE